MQKQYKSDTVKISVTNAFWLVDSTSVTLIPFSKEIL